MIVMSHLQVRLLLREMEEQLRWRAFAVQEALESKLKALLETPSGIQLAELDLESSAMPNDQDQLTLTLVRERVQQFAYVNAEELAGDFASLASATQCSSPMLDAIEEVFEIPRAAFEPKQLLEEPTSEPEPESEPELTLESEPELEPEQTPAEEYASADEPTHADEPSDTASIPGNVRRRVCSASPTRGVPHACALCSRSPTMSQPEPSCKKISRHLV